MGPWESTWEGEFQYLILCLVMIRSETEYREAVKRIDEEKKRLKEQQKALGEMDLSGEEIKRAMDPMRSFHEQLKEEVASYERLRQREFAEVRNFAGMGQLLIALRIAQGLSQRELAERLEVHESRRYRETSEMSTTESRWNERRECSRRWVLS